MSKLSQKARLYLSDICNVEKAKLFSESENEIVFEVNESVFKSSLIHMNKTQGKPHFSQKQNKEYYDVNNIFWKMNQNQYVVFKAQLMFERNKFFIKLSNRNEEMFQRINNNQTKMEAFNRIYDEFKSTHSINDINSESLNKLADKLESVGMSK